MSHQLAKRYLLVLTNCKDPEREDEFDRWYTNVHAPDILKTEGVVRFTRFKLAGRMREGQSRYLVLYEIDSDDDFRTVNERVVAGNIRQDDVRPLVETVALGYYEQVSEDAKDEG